jgi:hypothetical protein
LEVEVTDFVDSARKEIEDRLAQLRDEVKRLEAAAAALAGSGPTGRGRSSTRRSSGAKRGRPAGRSTGRRRGRPRGSGTRSAEAEKLVRGKPGITIPELAKEMSITPNYLYRVLPQLQKEKKVTKRGKGWHPVG